MMDLDPVLRAWQDATPWTTPLPDWHRDRAETTLEQLGHAHNLTLTAYEPPDEEWICARGPDVTAVASALFPLAFVTPGLHDVVRCLLPQVTVVPLASTIAADYRASPHILRSTLLRYGWTRDFSPSCFCLSDLLVESLPLD
jgi:hypothetical protein